MLVLFTILVTILIFVYINGRNNERYWKKRGVLFHPENKMSGVYGYFMTTTDSFFEILGKLYREYPNEPAVGLGSLLRRAIIVRDLVNVNHILVADFSSFSEGGIETPEYDVLTNSVIFVHGKKWRLLRQSMSPLFTAAKLKNMFYIIDKSAQDFIHLLKQQPQKLNENTFDNLTNFTCASITGAVFGIATESVFNSPFLKMSRKALEPSFRTNFKFALLDVFPWLYKALGIKLFGEHEKPFIGAIKHVIRERQQENKIKHDFVDLCIALKKNGNLKDPETNYQLEPTDELLAAQAFFYLTAGVEPCATAIFSTLMELGRNPDILQRVHEEIDNLFKETNGKLTYEIVTELNYLEKVMNEGLRMYPPAGFVDRRCVQDATLPTGNIKIEKGTHMYVPLFDIQRDPKYFPDPVVFNPDRFDSPTSVKMPFMPFSIGNRMCIGARLARLLVKTGLIYVLRHYTPETTVLGSEIKFKKQPFQVSLKNVDVKIIPRNIESN